jgi:hypothetical protein
MMNTDRREDDSWCGWLGLGPGNIKIDHVKALINEIMAVSTLLSGFSIGMSAKVTDSAIRSYASFLKSEFFGKDSHYCAFDVPQNLPGSRPLSALPSYDVADPNTKNPANAHCSADTNCWVGHWQTITAAAELGFSPCSMTAEEVQAAYPDYWEKQVMNKVANVQLELGSNTMTIIMTTVMVVSLGSLLRLSLVKRFDSPEAWLARFYPLVVVLAFMPLFNFYNFLQLASRVIRVLWYYCDDYITGQCMVTNTPGFQRTENILMAAGVVVWLLHMSLPRATPPASKSATATAPKADGASIEVRLERLVKMRDAGDLTPAEFTVAKASVLDGSASDAAAPPTTPMSGTGGGGIRLMNLSGTASGSTMVAAAD